MMDGAKPGDSFSRGSRVAVACGGGDIDDGRVLLNLNFSENMSKFIGTWGRSGGKSKAERRLDRAILLC